jgi:hypothetical protein
VPDVLNWTDTDATSLTRRDLGLRAGQTYWISVQAQNGGGLWSTSGYDDFVAGETANVLVFLPLTLQR